MVDQPKDGSVSRRMHLFENLEVQSGEDCAFPTKDGASGLASLDKGLRVYHRSMAHQGGPKQSSVMIDDSPLGRPGECRRSLQDSQGAACFFQSSGDSDSVTARGAVRFQR